MRGARGWIREREGGEGETYVPAGDVHPLEGDGAPRLGRSDSSSLLCVLAAREVLVVRALDGADVVDRTNY